MSQTKFLAGRAQVIFGALRPLTYALGHSSVVSLGLALGCVLVGAGLSAIAPVLLAGLVDAFLTGSSTILFPVGLYAACLGLARVAGEVRTFLHARAEQKVLRALTLKSSGHILSLPMPTFDRHPSVACPSAVVHQIC